MKIVVHIGSVEILGLPMPPSENQAYRPVAFWSRSRGKMSAKFVAKPALIEFKSLMETPSTVFRHELAETYRMFADKPLWIEREFVFPREKLYRKDGRPKKLDTTNRIKAFDDALARLIGIDDRWFIGGTAVKVSGETACVNVTIKTIPTSES